MALRAGVAVADIEFIQFHPTALHHEAMPRPLLSEALRGHGALLRDAKGERFVDELQPRDVVSRAITERMLELGIDHVFLDATVLEDFGLRFPTIAAALAEVGLDPAKDRLPVAPAAHYTCGGIVTDLDGRHLAARPVGGRRGGLHRRQGRQPAGLELAARGDGVRPPCRRGHRRKASRARPTGAMRAVLDGDDVPPGVIGGRPIALPPPGEGAPVTRHELQLAMTEHAGVLRSAESLAAALAAVSRPPSGDDEVATAEVANLAVIGRAVCAAAQVRTETRGAHSRVEHPDRDPALAVRLVIT